MEIQIELWSRSSYDDSERSRSSDDPDLAVEIQIEWWSRSCPERWSRSSDDPDPAVEIQIEWWSRSCPVMLIQIEWWSRSSDAIFMMIQIERWSRSRWLKDEDELKMKMTQMIQLMQRRRPVLKNLCRKNTFLVKRECWCICNFGMYSSIYFILL